MGIMLHNCEVVICILVWIQEIISFIVISHLLKCLVVFDLLQKRCNDWKWKIIL